LRRKRSDNSVGFFARVTSLIFVPESDATFRAAAAGEKRPGRNPGLYHLD
jgi:hypothetical protein